MKNKLKLYFDFDGTLTSSGEIICSLYNNKYSYHPHFLPARFEDCYEWSMSDVCPLASDDEIEEWFASHEFFERVVLFDGIEDIINEFHEKGHDIVFVTRCSGNNAKYKIKLLTRVFPYATILPVVAHWNKEVGKGVYNMKDGILIDDNSSYLHSSNAMEKICFNEHGNFNRSWNSDWVGLKAISVEDLSDKINWLVNKEV